MHVDSIYECGTRLYANGIMVIYRHSVGRDPDELRSQVKKKRTYSVKRLRVQSACVEAWVLKKSKHLLFLTFTFPFHPTETDAAKIWDLCLNSLRNTYNISTYVWIKEKQPKNDDRLHYHILVDSNYIDISALQGTFDNNIKNVFPGAVTFRNSVRLGRDPIVRYVSRIKTYLSKYISKDHNSFDSRCYGYSENLTLYRKLDPEYVEKILYGNKKSYEQIYNDQFFCLISLNNFEKTEHFKLFFPDQ